MKDDWTMVGAKDDLFSKLNPDSLVDVPVEAGVLEGPNVK